jgi:hypothetical protein
VYNQGGLTWQNSAQIIGGSIGVVGNAPGLRQTASDYPRLNPLNYSVTVDRSTLSTGGLGAFGAKYNPSSRTLVEQPRDTLGRFLPKVGGELRPGSLAEQATFNAVRQKPGWSVVDRPVSVRDATGQLRVYDGAAISPSGRVIGLETKSGTGRLTPAQRAFDTRLNSSSSSTAQGVGQSAEIIIQRSIQVRR